LLPSAFKKRFERSHEEILPWLAIWQTHQPFFLKTKI
jgi:hypothetical protein